MKAWLKALMISLACVLAVALIIGAAGFGGLLPDGVVTLTSHDGLTSQQLTWSWPQPDRIVQRDLDYDDEQLVDSASSVGVEDGPSVDLWAFDIHGSASKVDLWADVYIGGVKQSEPVAFHLDFGGEIDLGLLTVTMVNDRIPLIGGILAAGTLSTGFGPRKICDELDVKLNGGAVFSAIKTENIIYGKALPLGFRLYYGTDNSPPLAANPYVNPSKAFADGVVGFVLYIRLTK
ncbi:MAG: hypothetical protein LBR32_05670 [Propionibacteriaceae bacterium]|jgi:hypothetical protein|nr:hypothetical protein [Propionibacteriaceae bacterium]